MCLAVPRKIIDTLVESDSAALHTLVADMLAVTKSIRYLRDPTPGWVTMPIVLGTTRVVDMLAGDQLPRIC